MNTKLDFVHTYTKHIEKLKQENDYDSAMKLAIGGAFEGMGKLEYELLKYVGLKPTDAVVDVGCGSGRLAQFLAKSHQGTYLGVDVIAELVEYAEKLCNRPDWRFQVNDGYSIPAADNSADFVCFFSVFTHLLHEETFAYLQDAKRILKPQGTLVFSFLEFAEAAHWSIFAANIKNIGNEHPLNMFIPRDALPVWAEKLGLNIHLLKSGSEAFIPVGPNKGALWQSVCVMKLAS